MVLVSTLGMIAGGGGGGGLWENVSIEVLMSSRDEMRDERLSFAVSRRAMKRWTRWRWRWWLWVSARRATNVITFAWVNSRVDVCVVVGEVVGVGVGVGVC